MAYGTRARTSLAMVLALAAGSAVLGQEVPRPPGNRGQDRPAVESRDQGQDQPSDDRPAQPTTADAQAQSQVRQQVEQQRQQMQQQGEQSLDRDALAAIEETRNALRAIAGNNRSEALAAIERATGKINVLVARHPAAALIPFHIEIEVIEAAPRDLKEIRQLTKRAEDAVEDKDLPLARVLLDALRSEIHTRTMNLPLASYPVALQTAARLLDENKSDEAALVLSAALNTVAIVDRVTPLPMAFAQEAINQAQQAVAQDPGRTLDLLATARHELERARALGYAGNDPEYKALNSSIKDLERQIRANEDTGNAFTRLKERVTSFFKRHSDNESRSEQR